jgi:hypothetical protein
MKPVLVLLTKTRRLGYAALMMARYVSTVRLMKKSMALNVKFGRKRFVGVD